MTLKITLQKPIGGYWDGGLKDTFEFNIDGREQKDKKGKFVRIGSWEANYWFNVTVGKTEKLTLANAKRHLTSIFKRKELKVKFAYVE